MTTTKTPRIDKEKYETKTSLLWWQERGLSYTATGYGNKIPTTEMLFYNRRWRRIYCSTFSNCASYYILVNNERIIVD